MALRRKRGPGGLKVVIGTADIARVSREFRKIAQKHSHFAITRAVSDVAKEARDEVAAKLGESFRIRNKGMRRAIAHQPADRKDRRPTAFVGTRPWAKFLTLHALGGIKRGVKGHRIAIPTSRVQRTTTGRIRKTQQPRRLRQRKTLSRTELEKHARIAVRPGRRARDQRGIFYLLRPSVRIRKRWPFREQVEHVARRTLPKHFKRRLLAAMKRGKSGRAAVAALR